MTIWKSECGAVEIHHGDCLEVLRGMEDCSIDSVVTDPPYGLAFMGKKWDYDVPSEDIWRECLRVLKPGGHLLAFAGTRTQHRMCVRIEDAGFEIRDMIAWVYGCLSEDTEILVNGRWEQYHKAIVGSLALCYNAEHDQFQWEPIQELVQYDYDDTAFSIRSDHTDQIVSRNHRCIIERGRGYSFAFAETLEREARVPILENVQDLLESISMPHEGASEKESVLQPCVCAEEPRQDQANGRAKGENGCLSTVREGSLATRCVAEEVRDGVLFPPMQRAGAWCGMGEARAQGPRGVDEGIRRELRQQDEGESQPGMEGRRDVLPQARQLQADKVCSVSGGVFGDGTQGRICYGASAACCAGYWEAATAVGSGASSESRPTGQCDCESGTVCEQSRSQTLRGSRFTRPDLARVEPIHYRGKVWCIRVPSGAFVARRNGKVFVTGNSGFPKSHNLKDEWQGFGTALKPALEPITMARKPLTGTVAANVMEHGTGAINVDGCRVELNGGYKCRANGRPSQTGLPDNYDPLNANQPDTQGRWPANLIHDGSEEVVGLFPQTGVSSGGRAGHTAAYCGGFKQEHYGDTKPGFCDSGSAARFFYCAKASKADRDEGCEEMEEVECGTMDDDNYQWRDDVPGGRSTAKPKRRNHHPTVKPTDLMRYLCRLVTPPGGTILDPFTGSGSTGKAAILEGFRFIGIERERDYCDIAQARTTAVINGTPLLNKGGKR